jgi:PQQ-dependent dehydrogenase (methanol/ethanol family)
MQDEPPGRPREVQLTARPNVVWFVAAMTVVAGLGLADQQSDKVINPLSGNPAVEAGRRLFDQTCQSCHGPAGQGELGRGPALNTGSFAHGGEDADLFHTIRTGVPGSTMPAFARVTDERVWELVAYLRSLSPPVARAPVDPSVAVGNQAAGEGIFFGKAGCASCHEVNGRGGVIGPDLSAAGRAPASALREKILDPNRPAPAAAPTGGRAGGGRSGGGRGGALQPTTVVVKTRDGREIRGVRRSEDTFSLQMMDASGELHLLDKLKLSDIRVENISLMPGDYAARLATGEIDDVVAYLSTLQQRDTSQTHVAPPAGGVGHDRLVKASLEPQNWFMYWGNYQATHYSGLTQIDPGNVRQLQAIWALPISGDSLSETTPIVVDGVMYATGSGNPATVAALDARSGRPIWSWTRQQQVRNPYEINRFNRGVAVLGQRVFVGTLDAALIALDARTGRPLWEVRVADTTEGYSITSPPLALKDKIIVGISGGEFATRGFIDAYDAATGKRLWRFYTVPGPGEFGHDTWTGDSWEHGGAAPWLTGSYDPELNLLYWAAGNPAPHTDRTTRGEGDNLFSCSVLALDADTGQRKWHYQFTPNDGHDWDAAQDMILVDRVWHGQNRKLLLHADRNAFLYVIDRTNGSLLQATPFVHQTWNAGFDPGGRPLTVPGSNSSAEGSILVYPTLVGGTNFQAPSYSPVTGLLYLEYAEGGTQFTSGPAEIERGRPYTGQGRGRGAAPERGPADPPPSAGIKAIDPENGKTVWDFKISQGSLTNGVLATAGGVLFGAIRDGNIAAFDAKSGKPLWHFQTGGSMAASPMSYAVDGRQFVAIAAGNTLYAFALPEALP